MTVVFVDVNFVVSRINRHLMVELETVFLSMLAMSFVLNEANALVYYSNCEEL